MWWVDDWPAWTIAEGTAVTSASLMKCKSCPERCLPRIFGANETISESSVYLECFSGSLTELHRDCQRDWLVFSQLQGCWHILHCWALPRCQRIDWAVRRDTLNATQSVGFSEDGYVNRMRELKFWIRAFSALRASMITVSDVRDKHACCPVRIQCLHIKCLI